ncbi:hypothetical protein PJE062_5236 [Pseudovibrio sp. JE062]|nr:hypothetical protein PJE062_5236 [Pseudovibrio sp. JE062]
MGVFMRAKLVPFAEKGKLVYGQRYAKQEIKQFLLTCLSKSFFYSEC